MGKESIYYHPDLELAAVEQSLGKLVTRSDIPSSIKEFYWYPEAKVEYPPQIVKALEQIYDSYNQAFAPFVLTNQEWPTDYQNTFNPSIGPINYFVQIDMAGLTPNFIEAAKKMTPEELIPELMGRIFEIENSLAMYNFMRGIFQKENKSSVFQMRFDAALEDLRQRFKKPIALLAVTDQKYQAMLATEFGIENAQESTEISPQLVRERSGFDMFFGPRQFQQYLAQNNNQCDYLLYTRTSLPVIILRNPTLRRQLEIPLLEDQRTRQIIKANSIMFNIDDPSRYREEPIRPERIINDTKIYMMPMGLGFPVYRLEDLQSEGFIQFLETKGLTVQGVILHAKPMVLSYGAYGHVKGRYNKEFRNLLRKGLRERGPYVIQPEIITPTILNLDNNQHYHFIDRNFFYCSPDGKIHFIGGLRNLMPVDIFSREKLKVHGNKEAVWVEITDQNNDEPNNKIN